MVLELLALMASAGAVVQMDFTIRNNFEVQEHTPAHLAMLRRRTVEPVLNASLTTSYNFYYGQLYLGLPTQQLDVLLDTGSPISWVYGPAGSYNNATMFFPNASETFSPINWTFSAAYGSGEYLGYWGQDLAAAPQFIGKEWSGPKHQAPQVPHHMPHHPLRPLPKMRRNYSVPFEFGVVTSFATSAGAPGLLGLGPHILTAGPRGYLSLPEAYAKYNVTSSSAFSIFLEQQSGRFLFGGVDLRYAELPLYLYTPSKTPLSASPDAQTNSGSWLLQLDSVSFNNTHPYLVSSPVTLDTGSPVNLLPPGFVNAVGQSYNLTKYGRYEVYYTNGSTEHITGNITFDFGGIPFETDIKNFLVPGEYIWLDDGPQNVTALALMGSPNYLLGDAFFRSVYTVLDPSTGNVLLAKRTGEQLNEKIDKEARDVVPFAELANNATAVVNATAAAASAASSLAAEATNTVFVTVSTNEIVTVSTPVVVAANRYYGTVPAEKAAKMTNESVSATSVSAASASAAGGSASTSKQSSSATVANPQMLLAVACAVAIALI